MPNFKIETFGYPNAPKNFSDLVDIFLNLIRVALPIIVGLALLIFIWGLIKFIFRVGGGDEKAVQEGKKLMIWGLIALFIMISIWGILRFLYGVPGFGGSFGYPVLPVN